MKQIIQGHFPQATLYLHSVGEELEDCNHSMLSTEISHICVVGRLVEMFNQLNFVGGLDVIKLDELLLLGLQLLIFCIKVFLFSVDDIHILAVVL